jgi:uncharacterized membrane protein
MKHFGVETLRKGISVNVLRTKLILNWILKVYALRRFKTRQKSSKRISEVGETTPHRILMLCVVLDL